MSAERKLEILRTVRSGATWAGTVRGKRLEMWVDQCGRLQVFRVRRGGYATFEAETVTEALELA
jgi:hypothetical protein